MTSVRGCCFNMKVRNRDGQLVEIHLEEIKNRNANLLYTPEERAAVDIDKVIITVVQGITDGIKTSELDDLCARVCADRSIEHYMYDVWAARILVSNWQKNVRRILHAFAPDAPNTFSTKTWYLHEKLGMFNNAYVSFVKRNAERLDEMVRYERDATHTYFSLRTLERSYLTKEKPNGQCIESPQDMWMRVSIAIHMPYSLDVDDDADLASLSLIEETYAAMSNGHFTHATPTLFNAGSTHQQCSSCFAADTQIVTVNAGVKSIQDVKIGDLVVTHLGSVKKVTQLHCNPLGTRNLHKLVATCNKDMMVTGNHRLWAVRLPDESPTWHPVESLRPGDRLMLPCVDEGQLESVAVGNADWKINESFAWFIGKCFVTASYLFGTDSLVKGMSFPVGSADNLEWLIHVGETTLDAIGAIDVAKSVVVFTPRDTTCSKFPSFYETFQTLPPFMFSQSRQIIASMLSGFVNNQCGITTVNVNDAVATQMYHLLRMHGMMVSYIECKQDELSESSKYVTITSNEVVTDDLPENVYTLGVEDDHSYAVHGVLAENCYLLGTEDSLSGIYKTISDAAQISKWAGGIGIHVSNVRAKGSTIKSTNGVSDGVVPMLKVYNETIRYCNQSGRRKGSAAIYMEPWHADIWEFVELRKQIGAETERCRDLFLALWVPDEFMTRVVSNADWYLMSPDESPGLTDVYGEAFTELYNSYIAAGKYVRKVSAVQLWQHIIQTQMETGMPYMTFKCNVNRKNNQSNVGIIRSSNLCNEVVQYSDADMYAVCNLASIAVNRFYDTATGVYDFGGLHRVAKMVTRNLNKIVDINFYPTPETRRSNMKLRPLGIGIQGLADLLCVAKLPFESTEAVVMDAHVMETIYHGALEASVELAAEDGPYELFDGSPFSRGELQLDLWNLDESKMSGRWDWNELRERMKSVGARNSMLTALMPTASTSQILGNAEAFEPFHGNVFKRSTLAGEYVVVNKHLMRDLITLGVWDESMRRAIMENDGSVQAIPRVPVHLKEVYKTVWEVSLRSIVDHALARGPFVDQSQSMNLFMGAPNFQKLSSALIYGWRNGIKTGMYYLRSKPSAEAIKYSLLSEGPVCRRDNADCVSCSA